MSDAAISLLEGFTLGNPMGSHFGVSCCPAIRGSKDQKYIVKRISIPYSQNQLDALLITGAYKDPRSASEYFHLQAQEIADEAALLEKISRNDGFLPFEGCEIAPMKENYLGYDVFLVSNYRLSLEKYMRHQSVTHLEAVNLGLDMCAALESCRKAGMMYIDLKPSNIFVSARKTYKIGDLGFMPLRSIKYSSMPQKYCGPYTAPELLDDFNTLNETADTYALGMILYQIFNNGKLPEDQTALTAPANADTQIAAIILKACDPLPENRWTNPSAMGQALVDYMQSSTINNTLIMAPLIPTEKAATKNDAAESLSESPETAETSEEAAVPETTAEEMPEETEAESFAPVMAEAEDAQPVVQDAPEESAPIPEESFTEPTEAPITEEAPVVPEEVYSEDIAPEEEPPYQPLEEPLEKTMVFQPPQHVSVDPQEADEPAVSVQEEYEPLFVLPSDDTETAYEPHSYAKLETPEENLQETEPTFVPVLNEDPPSEEDYTIHEDSTENWEQFTQPEEPDLDTALEEANHLLSNSAVTPPKRTPPAPVTKPVKTGKQAKSASKPVIKGNQNVRPVKDTSSKKKKKHGFLKFLIGLLTILMLLAVGAAGYLYYQDFYLQTVDSISVTGTLDQLTVTVKSNIDEDLLTVICSDTYGTPTAQGLTNGQATFTGLKPGTLYKVDLEISGYHKLVGQTSDIFTTDTVTTITSMTAIAGSEDGSVLLSFTAEGFEPSEWQITCSTDASEDIIHIFSGHTTTLEGLEVGKDYIFQLNTGDGSPLVGENTLEFSVTPLIFAQNLAVKSILDGELVVSWDAPADSSVENWKARCYNDSYDETVMLTETTATFSGIHDDLGYTVEVTAEGMTQPARISITEHPITVTGMNVDDSQKDGLHITWDTVGLPPDGGWQLIYSVDGSAPAILKSQASTAVVSPKVPAANYTFSLQAADGTSVFGGDLTYESKKPDLFLGHAISAYKLSITLLPYPGNGWNYFNTPSNAFGDTFKPGQSISLVLKVSANFYLDDDPVSILYVIRDEDGNVLPDLTVAKEANWAHLWDASDYHYASLDACKAPTQPGSYTLFMYMDGMAAASAPFTVS